MTRWVRKLTKPMAALGILGLLGQSLMLGCIGTATASAAPGAFARAAAEQGASADFHGAGAPGKSVPAMAGHDQCAHYRGDNPLPTKHDDECCDWAGLSPFAGGSPVRGMSSSTWPDLKFTALTADIVAVYRPAAAYEPQPALSPPAYHCPLYLLDCAFLE